MFEYLYKSKKPFLSDNAPLLIDLFSGGGGIKTGAVMAGFIPHGVEKDPDNPELSNTFAKWHKINFSEYGSTTIVKTVQEMYLSGWQGLPRNALWGHASPVCTRFSGFSRVNNEKEDLKDITSAKAVADAIAFLNCNYWSIEQVPNYINSDSFK
ncbi:MAG: DNA cytosine methyltransferase, partial [Cyanobacteria bacterium J06628_3]